MDDIFRMSQVSVRSTAVPNNSLKLSFDLEFVSYPCSVVNEISVAFSTLLFSFANSKSCGCDGKVG